MSLYGKEMELLSYVEELQALRPGLKCRFWCRCWCEASFVSTSPYPAWRVHDFATVGDARAWLALHKGHEAYVDVRFEALRPVDRDRRGRSTGSERDSAGLFYGAGPAKRGELTEKLRALAKGTPYAHEAETALRKIAELNRICAADATEAAAESGEQGPAEPPERGQPTRRAYSSTPSPAPARSRKPADTPPSKTTPSRPNLIITDGANSGPANVS